jgi:hypothetical protein
VLRVTQNDDEVGPAQTHAAGASNHAREAA